MTAAQPVYDYSSYDYSYDANAAAAYSYYPGYDSSAMYGASGVYDSYATSATHPTGTTTEQSYTGVDPYASYATSAYCYPSTNAGSTDAKSSIATQSGYSSSYSSSQASTSYGYESKDTPKLPEGSANHYAAQDYDSNTSNGRTTKSSSTDSYLSYKNISAGNVLSSSTNYEAYATSAPSSHLYPPSMVDMIPHQMSYYPSNQVPHTMHYVHQQPQRMVYRLPPRGGYQRELDEPGDENDLLRHVVYITGLPKEIQNDTLAEVFGAACGLIAPVDVRSPKPKIWVYKDRQTREGKGEATITFINPESCQLAINYFNGKELFGREIRVTRCPRRLYNMQKQNTPFHPAASSNNTITSTSSIIKLTTNDDIYNSNNNLNSIPKAFSTSAETTSVTSSSTIPITTTVSSNIVTGANPISTISSSTFGLPRHMNHSLFKVRQTAEQQRGLFAVPQDPSVTSMINSTFQRDSTRKELSRVAQNKGNINNSAVIRSKPY